jgi:hypothetical protein
MRRGKVTPRDNILLTLIRISTAMLWMGMFMSAWRLSAGARMMVGPKTMPRLLAFILLDCTIGWQEKRWGGGRGSRERG